MNSGREVAAGEWQKSSRDKQLDLEKKAFNQFSNNSNNFILLPDVLLKVGKKC